MIALADDCMGGDHDPRITPARRRCPRAHQFGAQWLVCHAMRSGAALVIFCPRHAKTITRPLWVRRNAYMPVAQVARDGADILWLGPCRHAGNRGWRGRCTKRKFCVNQHMPNERVSDIDDAGGSVCRLTVEQCGFAAIHACNADSEGFCAALPA